MMLLETILAQGEDINFVLLIGIVIFAGTVGAKIIQRLRIPQIVGYVVIGILLGPMLGVISQEMVHILEPLTMVALGIIGFMIGGELRRDVFKKYGRQFFIILFSQGIGAFLLVAVGTSLLAWLVTGNLSTSIAMGLVLGAVASATAPAATVNVLWEYKTRGPLTAAVLAIVALDDALALLLYRMAATGADALTGAGRDSVLVTTGVLFAEIIGAILLGFLTGAALHFILKLVRAEDKILVFSLSGLLLVIGISMVEDIGPILPAMTLGVTVANLAPRASKSVFGAIEKFSPPIYVSFFVLAGAHLEFDKMAPWILGMIAVYTLCRVFGKVAGSWLGASYSRAPETVRKYLGICLLPQAGVAIGLAILASRQFNSEIGHTIVMVVMMATFLMEILGPMLVKMGVKKAGEVGLNITEEELIETYNVGDVMDTKVPIISAGMSLSEVIKVVSSTDNFYYSVVDNNKKLIGAITLDGIRNTFTTQELNDWLVALDIVESVILKVTSDIALADAFEKAGRLDIEHVPVTASIEDDRFVGLLDCRSVRRALSAEVLERQRKADNIGVGGQSDV